MKRSFRNHLAKVSRRAWTTPFLTLLFLGAIVLLLSTVIFELPKSIASLAWPTTEGVVLSSDIHLMTGWSEDSEGWAPSVSYRYSVNGREYVSGNIEIQDVGNGNTDYLAYQVIQRYPVGERVKIYYNPGDPTIAVLEPGIPDNEPLWVLLITTATVTGAILLILGLLGMLGVGELRPSSRNPSAEERAS
jgi:hypothetical protein